MVDRSCPFCEGEGKVLVKGEARQCPACGGSGMDPLPSRTQPVVPGPVPPGIGPIRGPFRIGEPVRHASPVPPIRNTIPVPPARNYRRNPWDSAPFYRNRPGGRPHVVCRA